MASDSNPNSPTKIRIKDNGSIEISADTPDGFELLDMEGNRYDLGGRTKISLCRCGASKNAPFCDGSHNQCNFQSKVQARALPPKAN